MKSIRKINPLSKATIAIALVLSMLLSSCDKLQTADPTPSPTAQVDTTLSNEVVISEGNLEPRENKYLTFTAAGRVAEILVDQGAMVKEGDVLARLGDSQPAQAALAAANLELASAQQALDELNRTANLALAESWAAKIQADQALIDAQRAWDQVNTDDYETKIETEDEKVADAEQELNNAKDDFDPYKNLPEDNAKRKDAQTKLDDAQKKYDDAVRARDELIIQQNQAKANLDQAAAAQAEAQRKYEALSAAPSNGPDPDLLNLATLRMKAAKAQQAAAQAALDNYQISAPFDGTIMDINVLPGEQVGPTTWALLLADLGPSGESWYVRTNDLTELEVVNVQPGQKVSLTPDALPDLKLTGTVEEISQTFRSQAGDILYDVLIRLDETDPRLRWGMTFEVMFEQ